MMTTAIKDGRRVRDLQLLSLEFPPQKMIKDPFATNRIRIGLNEFCGRRGYIYCNCKVQWGVGVVGIR